MPSWLKVIATTLRLWVRRRVLHVPDSGSVRKRDAARSASHQGRGRRVAWTAAAAVIVVAASAGVALAVHARQDASARSRALAQEQTRAAAQARAAAAARTAAAARVRANVAAAAAWIAAEAGARVRVGCDPATCSAVEAAGHPAGDEVILRAGSSLPGIGSLVVATPAVRADYRPANGGLAGSAPAMIAAFGSGPDAVQVREVVAGGGKAYGRAAARALAARRTAGHSLLRGVAHRRGAADGRDTVAGRGAAKADLTSGLVDPRLTTVLSHLGARYPVWIVRFAGAAPQAAVLYRQAEIVVPDAGRTGARHKISDLAGMEKVLRGQPAGYRPRLTVVRLPGGQSDLQIWFPAPSPL